MTEEEWFASRDLRAIVGYLARETSDRKLRLFTVACCRRIWDLIVEPDARHLVELAEAFADGEPLHESIEEVSGRIPWEPSANAAAKLAAQLAPVRSRQSVDFYIRGVREAIEAVLSRTQRGWASWLRQDHERRETIAQIFFVRDIVGNPFRPVAFAPQWRTSTAVQLARGMYEGRDFSAMPILADALQDAGCEDADILTHCRDPQQVHVRGCWVVDLALGKS